MISIPSSINRSRHCIGRTINMSRTFFASSLVALVLLPSPPSPPSSPNSPSPPLSPLLLLLLLLPCLLLLLLYLFPPLFISPFLSFFSFHLPFVLFIFFPPPSSPLFHSFFIAIKKREQWYTVTSEQIANLGGAKLLRYRSLSSSSLLLLLVPRLLCKLFLLISILEVLYQRFC